MDIRKLVKECVTQVLKEELEDPFYVEYHSQRSGEEPFMLHGQKFEYVNAKYPGGKIDVGVYAFAGDMVYSYNAFREMYNIKEELTEGGWNNSEPTQYRIYNGGKSIWYANFDPDKNTEIPGTSVFTYTSEHIPSGKKFVKFVACDSKEDFDLLLDYWNKQSPSTWKYVTGYVKEAFDPTSVGPNPEASEGLSDGNPYPAWNAKMRQMENLPPGGEKKYSKQQPGGEMSAVNTTTIANEENNVSPSFILVGINSKRIELESEKSTIEQAYEDVEQHFWDMAEYEGDADLHAAIKAKYPDMWIIESGAGLFALFDQNSSSNRVSKMKNILQNTGKFEKSNTEKTMYGWNITSIVPNKDISIMREKDNAYFVIADKKDGTWKLSDPDIFQRITKFGVPEPIISRLKIQMKSLGLMENSDVSSNPHGRYAQEAGAAGFGKKDFDVNKDPLDELRKIVGNEKVDEFLSKFGLDPARINEWDQLDPELRKKQLSARPPGYSAKMIKQRSDQMAKDMVDKLKKQHSSNLK